MRGQSPRYLDLYSREKRIHMAICIYTFLTTLQCFHTIFLRFLQKTAVCSELPFLRIRNLYGFQYIGIHLWLWDRKNGNPFGVLAFWERIPIYWFGFMRMSTISGKRLSGDGTSLGFRTIENRNSHEILGSHF
jgi:hypothetical protein